MKLWGLETNAIVEMLQKTHLWSGLTEKELEVIACSFKELKYESGGVRLVRTHTKQTNDGRRSKSRRPYRRGHTQIQTSVVFSLVDVIGLLPFPVGIKPQPLSIIALASRTPHNDYKESDQEDEEDSESQPQPQLNPI